MALAAGCHMSIKERVSKNEKGIIMFWQLNGCSIMNGKLPS